MSTAVLTAVGFLVLAAVALFQLRETMIEDRIAKVRNLSETARGLVKGIDERAKAGEFDQVAAQAMARQLIEALRYDEDEYFFAYDYDGNSTAHGSRPDRVGKNFLDSKDSSGQFWG